MIRFTVATAVVVAAVLATLPGGQGTRVSALVALASPQQAASGGYSPSQIDTAYNLSPLVSQSIDGTGQAIALVEFGRFDPLDISAFDAANGLPDPAIQQYFTSGTASRRPLDPETTMDIEWAHALAPGATIQIYYMSTQNASPSAWASIATAITMAQSHGARTVSMSFGTCSPTKGYTVLQTALASALKHGVSTFVSSGDTGALPGSIHECGSQSGVGYPASDPSVVAVGGTSLTLNPDDTLFAETAWRLSGGGSGKPLRRPIWQTTPTLSHGRYRYAPDVSFLGNPSTGAAVYYNGRWVTAGGTSLGAPAWAAIWSLVIQHGATAGKAIGAAPTLLYRVGNSAAYSSAFHDVLTGTNGRYQAGPGWDAVTGWGTPKVGGLVAAIEAVSPAAH